MFAGLFTMQPSSSERPAYLPQLTGLRFLAAMGVIICHFATYMVPTLPDVLARFSWGFFNAVSLFFVLSGFILAHTYGESLSTKTVTFSKYLFARISRIYPVFLFALLIDVPVFVVNNKAQFTGATKYHLFQKVLLLQTWLLGPVEVTYRWNAPSWSLSTESFFYLTFPLFLAVIYKLKVRASWLALGLMLLLTTVISVFYERVIVKMCPMTTDLGQTIHGFIMNNPLVRVLEFVARIALYNLYRYSAPKLRAVPRRTWNTALVIGAIAYASINMFAPEMVISQGLCTAFFSFVILGLALELFGLTKTLQGNAAVKLGEASYSLYLIHFPIFHTAFAIARKVPGLNHLKEAYSLPFGLILVGVSVGGSLLCYRYIESPARKYLLSRYAKSRFASI